MKNEIDREELNNIERGYSYRMDADEELGGLAISLLNNVLLYLRELLSNKGNPEDIHASSNVELINSDYFLKSSYNYIKKTAYLELNVYNEDSNDFAQFLKNAFERVGETRETMKRTAYFERNYGSDVICQTDDCESLDSKLNTAISLLSIALEIAELHKEKVQNGIASTSIFEIGGYDRDLFTIRADEVISKLKEIISEYQLV